QSSILVSQGCGGGPALQIHLQTETTTKGFPIGASYQPGGTLLLGLFGSLGIEGGNIGLADETGKFIRTLVTHTTVSVNTQQQYSLLFGRAIWSQDGQSVWYEYNDDLWHVQADGSNAHLVVPGTAYDQHLYSTVQLLGAFSSNGKALLYLQLKGSDENTNTD